MKKIIILFILSLALTTSVYAQSGGVDARSNVLDGLGVTAGQADITQTNPSQDPSIALASFLGGAINYAFGVVGIVFVTIIMIGGYLWMVARGDVDKVSKAKTFIMNGIFGLMVIVLSWALVFVILQAVGNSTGVA